ncbi:MAG: hypothetical protein M3409_07520 [Gemmatimonadota bacterium]|nr:hypothetical protein [Gemmatimonadota bacterium]
MDPLLPLLTALAAGFLHALEPDHMAAVTTFVARRPRPLRALGFGLRWGAGHSVAILVVGIALIVLDVRIPDGVSRGLEFGVGTLLMALGLWLLWSVLHDRAHAAAGPGEHPHHHAGGSGWVGVAHGLAGTAPLVALLPVALGGSPLWAGAYLLVFGVGTVAAMGFYALVAGVVFDRASIHSESLARGIRLATALASTAIGVLWMHGAVASGA